MSARAHPRLIGAFVLGAIVLVLAAIVLLSSGGLFQNRNRFVVFFPGSVKGLQKGSEVTFRGVRVGDVVDVRAFQTGLPDNPIQIEVVCELYRYVVETPEGVKDVYKGLNQKEAAALLIKQGVRARMLSASLLTGQKYIDLDFLPNEPARLAGLSRRYPEIPSTPTALEKLSARLDDLLNKLAEMPLDQLVEDLQQTIRAARDLLQSEDLKGALAGARRGARAIEPTLEETQKTLKAAREVIEELGKETAGLGDDAKATLAELRDRLAQTEKVFESVDATLRGADDARMDISATLAQLQRALESARNLLGYIEAHPESLLQGKGKKKE
jgi:paraquat-inducible protein B